VSFIDGDILFSENVSTIRKTQKPYEASKNVGLEVNSENVYIKLCNTSFSCCFVWVWNLASHL